MLACFQPVVFPATMLHGGTSPEVLLTAPLPPLLRHSDSHTWLPQPSEGFLGGKNNHCWFLHCLPSPQNTSQICCPGPCGPLDLLPTTPLFWIRSNYLYSMLNWITLYSLFLAGSTTYTFHTRHNTVLHVKLDHLYSAPRFVFTVHSHLVDMFCLCCGHEFVQSMWE